MEYRMGEADLEQNRLDKLFDIAGKVLRHKPNRVIGATYTVFLRDGKVFNIKGEEVRL